MRSILFTALLLLFTGIVGAQDLIVTNQGDSINCFAQLKKSGKSYRLGRAAKDQIIWFTIPSKRIQQCIKGFYKNVPNITTEIIKLDNTYSRWRFAIDAGYGYRIGKIDTGSSIADNYMSNLRHGFMKNVAISYFWKRNHGFGLLYESHCAKYKSLGINSDIKMHHIIGTYTTRIMLNSNRDVLYASYGLGAVILDQKMRNSQGYSLLAEDTGFSAILETGYDWGISKNFALGVRLAYTTGTINYKNIEEKESTNHLSLTLGLRYYVW